MVHDKFYIDGQWVAPHGAETFTVINPSTESPCATIAMGDATDVDRAVDAAKRALPAFMATSKAQRLDLLRRILVAYRSHYEEFAQLMSLEMGAPITFAREAQAMRGVAHLTEAISVLEKFDFEWNEGTTRMRLEPIGVCGLITPWNWPINQIVVKLAPAIAAGCTTVLKPSEFSPLSSMLFARVMDEAGVPAGVFNLILGDGLTTGARLAEHSDVAMISFTGSTRAGIEVARCAAPTVKRVAQELGGKSANILLDDVDLEQAVTKGLAGCFTNSGQSCSIPTRMLVPRALMAQATDIAARVAADYIVGPADKPDSRLGPVVNKRQFESIQAFIADAMAEGATLIAGGPGRVAPYDKGYYVRPTVFSDVTPDMRVAREEIFGPVLVMMAYDSVDHAVDIANGTKYGLAGYVQGKDPARVQDVARRLQAGTIHLNYPHADFGAAFGGYKQSGNGREWGKAGLMEYLELKSMVGFHH
nr:aldehyde dehydrogenase family protein [Advenella mimigardefordensis]